jgi:hypothetical protein
MFSRLVSSYIDYFALFLISIPGHKISAGSCLVLTSSQTLLLVAANFTKDVDCIIILLCTYRVEWKYLRLSYVFCF